VAFATGVPMYSIVSVHNGRKFKCDCFPYKTVFKVPRFNMELDMENPSITFSDGTVVYYEDTSELNGTTVSFAVKKHNRSKFSEAVEEQLLYLDGIDFKIVNNETVPATVNVKPTKAKVAYVSKNLILSDSAVFNKPHIVIVRSLNDQSGINYGMIDFRELEMEDLYGSIGFKCPVKQSYRDADGTEIVLQDGVAVTPSREKVVWNDETRAYVQRVLAASVDEAQSLVSSQIAKTDSLLDWIILCRNVFGRLNTTTSIPGSKEDVLNRLSRIVDIQKISPVFTLGEHTMKYANTLKTMLPGIVVEKVSMSYNGTITINELEFLSELPPSFLSLVYLKDGNYSKAKNYHLCHKIAGNKEFITFKPKDITVVKESTGELSKTFKDLIYWQEHILSYGFPSYDAVVVPEEVEKVLASTSADILSPSERRILQAKEVGFTFRYESDYASGSHLVLDKVEPSQEELLNSEQPVYVFTSAEVETAKRVAEIIWPLVPTASKAYGTYDSAKETTKALFTLSPSLRLRSYSNANNVNTQDFPHFIQLNASLISKLEGKGNIQPLSNLFYQRINGTVMSMDPMLVNLYTAFRIGQNWNENFQFLANFADIYPELHAKYRKLERFMYPYTINFFGRAHKDDNPIWKQCDALYEFQLYCATDPSPEELRNESFRRFIFTDISDALMVHQEYIDLYNELNDFSADISNILGNLKDDAFKREDVQFEIKRYLSLRDRDNWQWGELQEEEESDQISNLNTTEQDVHIHSA